MGLIREGVEQKSIFKHPINGKSLTRYEVEVPASTEQLARYRAKAWARNELGVSAVRETTVLDSEIEGNVQTTLSEWVPETFSRNRYMVEIAVID